MDPASELERLMLEKQKPIKDAIVRGDSSIQTFYKGSKILITGGYGFIGKLIIEKLFRACVISKIYVLIRPKKNMTAKDRLADILQDSVFDNLYKDQPDFVNKIIPIEGDIAKLNIGIDDDSWNTIVEEVDVIFHAAANIRFDAPLKEPVLSNVRGTREMLRFCRSCKKLRACVFISTAYSHATRSREGLTIAERFYESPASPEAIIQLAENLDELELHNITRRLKRDWPNTYTISKALAEEVLRAKAGDMPICIVKPSIVISPYCEPAPGWLDTSCVFGATGYVLGTGIGLIHTMMIDRRKRLDLVPADLVANAVIASAWDTARNRRKTNEPKIYAINSARNPMTWGFQADVLRYTGMNYVSPSTIWLPFGIETKYKSIFWLLTWILHYIPAYVADVLCFIVGKPQKLVHLYTKVHKMCDLFSFFCHREWIFQDDNLQKLYIDMSEMDRTIFNFNITTVDMKTLIAVWLVGIRKYILKDGLQGTEYAKKKIFWLRILNFIVLTVYALCWLMLLAFILRSTNTMFNYLSEII